MIQTFTTVDYWGSSHRSWVYFAKRGQGSQGTGQEVDLLKVSVLTINVDPLANLLKPYIIIHLCICAILMPFFQKYHIKFNKALFEFRLYTSP